MEGRRPLHGDPRRRHRPHGHAATVRHAGRARPRPRPRAAGPSDRGAARLVTIGVTARRAGLIVIVGLATGVLSQLAQDLLPGEWSQLGNAISPWLLVAFLLGSRMPDARWAVAAGIVALLAAVIGFYAT